MSRVYATSTASAPVIRPIPPREPEKLRTVRIAAKISMPLQLHVSIAIVRGLTLSGSKLTLDGAVMLAGIGATLSFAHRDSAAQEKAVASEVMLIQPGEWLVTSSASPPIMIARNSPIQIQVRDSSGAPLAEICNIDRCYDGRPRTFGVSVRLPATLVAEVTSDGASFGPRSRVTLGGRLVFGRGILVRCLFGEGGENPEKNVKRLGIADIVAIDVGQTISFPDQLVEPPGAALSLRQMVFRDADGNPLTSNGFHGAVYPREAPAAGSH